MNLKFWQWFKEETVEVVEVKEKPVLKKFEVTYYDGTSKKYTGDSWEVSRSYLKISLGVDVILVAKWDLVKCVEDLGPAEDVDTKKNLD